MRKNLWEKNLLELIRRTSTDLPGDVENALRRAARAESKGSNAHWALQSILESAELSRTRSIPICQDTGTLVFYFIVPVGFDTNALVARVRAAVARATGEGYLRQNTVDSISGEFFPTNIAHASPVFHFRQGARKTVDVRLIMKGGGCENAGRQYSLPDPELAADCNLKGVRRCILDAVWQVQGGGCGPGALGVCIGGDRASGYAHSKGQFLHKLGETSRVRLLGALEKRVLRDTRKLGIGPMGVGGKSSLLGLHVGALSRLPSSYFVTVSYMCWVYRRRGVVLGPEGGVHRWLY